MLAKYLQLSKRVHTLPARHAGVVDDHRLRQLGYASTLRRRLHLWHVVGLSLAYVGPTATVSLIATAVLSVGGTFALTSNFIIGLIVIPIALCLAELGALYPVSGGVYSIIRATLPRPIMWFALLNLLIAGVASLAFFSLGIAPFLKNLIPSLSIPDQSIAIAGLVGAIVVALVRVELGALVIGVMVVVESIVLGLILIAGVVHPHQALGSLLAHPTYVHDSALAPVTSGIILLTLPAAFSMISGYESVLGFSEELNGPKLVKAMTLTPMLAIVLITLPLIAAARAAPNLLDFLQSNTPVIYSMQHVYGAITAKVFDVCISMALFTAAVSTLMYYARIFYATARDQLWPAVFSRRVQSLNAHKIPQNAVLLFALLAAPFIFVNALNWLVIFAGTCVAVLYFLIGYAALRSRSTKANKPRPYSMPLWPTIPLLVMCFVAFVLSRQGMQYLAGILVLAICAGVLWGIERTARR